MKCAILQESFSPGNIEGNHKKVASFYQKASKEDVDVAIVPSEALCGFEPEDLLNFNDFSERLEKIQKSLVRATDSETALIFDTPIALDGSFSPSIIVAYDGCIQHVIPQFDTVPMEDQIVEIHNGRILVTYCSSIASLSVQELLATAEVVDICILLDARPFSADSECQRFRFIENLATSLDNLVYVGQSGFQNGDVLTGASCWYKEGKRCIQFPYFEARSGIFDTGSMQPKQTPSIYPVNKEKMTALLYKALVQGVKGYFESCGITQAVIGLSGGIDSSVVLPVAVDALGCQNVTGLLMPSRFSSDHSVADAVKLAQNLHISYEIIPIEPLYGAFLKQLAPIFQDTPFGLAEENLQARIRGNLLMAVANKKGAMLLNTSNKSESCCGYGTLYGDLCGGLSVLGDLYKSQVYDIARHINKKKEIIPENCIRKAPSAELRPNQKDSDTLPDYDTIEQVLRMFLEKGWGVEDIAKEGTDARTAKRILDLFYKNVFKRRQTPPVIRLSDTVLERDIHLPLVCR